MLTVQIQRKWQTAKNIVCFELTAPERTELPRFEAGAHIDVHLKNGLIRQYSIYNAPTERHRYCIAVLLDPASRGGSIYMHDALKVGDFLEISMPRNLFPLAKEASHHLLFAGGIGITPLLSMANALLENAQSFALHYCARSIEHMAFYPEISQSNLMSHSQFYFDNEPGNFLIQHALHQSYPANTHLYICGPAGFIEYVWEQALLFGFSVTQLHREYFRPHQIANTSNVATVPTDTHGVTTTANKVFKIKLQQSCATYQVNENETIAQVLQRAGVPLETSCNEGVCGVCLTEVVDGEPDHRDMFLSAQEKKECRWITPCCSRAHSNLLVLNL